MDVSELGNELIDADIDGSVFGHLHNLPAEDLSELLGWMGNEAKTGNERVMPVASRAVEVTLLKARDGQESGTKCQEALVKMLAGFEEGVDNYSESQLKDWLELALLAVLSTHHNEGARHTLDKPCLGDFNEEFRKLISEVYFDVVVSSISSTNLSASVCEMISSHLSCVGATRRSLQLKVTESVLTLTEAAIEPEFCPQALRSSIVLSRFYNILKASYNTTTCPESVKSSIQKAFEAAKSHPHATISVQLTTQKKEKEVPRFDMKIPGKGLLTRSEVNAIILEGLKALEPWETIGQQHLQGLEQNQIDAARKLQMIELENFKKASAQTATADDDGDIPVAKLLRHAERKEQALHAGRDAIRNMQDETLEAVFSSLADTCRYVSQEGIGPAYHSIALLTRFSAQIAQSGSNVSSLNKIVLEEVCRPKQSFSLTLNSALQYLYSHYATLAPFSMKDDPILLQPDFDTRDDQPNTPSKQKTNKTFTFSECAADSAYVSAFNDLITGLGSTLLMEPHDEKEYHGREQTTFLSELLINCPAIPAVVWKSIEDRFCKSGDELLIWAGVNAISSILLNRPACTDSSLSQLMKYCAESSDELLSSIAINMLINDILPKNPSILDRTISYVRNELSTLIQSTDSNDLRSLHGVVTLYLSLCCTDISLFNYLFDLVDEQMQRLLSDKKRDEKEINPGLATVFRHEYLTKLLMKMGSEEALLLVKERPTSALSLHILQTIISELKNEIKNAKENETTREEVELINNELLIAQQIAKDIYESHGDMRYLIAQLSLTSKEEITTRILPGVIKKCRSEHVRYAIKEAITPLPCHYSKGIGLNPGAVLLYLHQLVPGENDITTKNIVVALDCCLLDLKNLFSDQEVAQSLQQLITLDPIPMVLMRTVLQAVHSHPNLLSYILSSIIPHLYQKSIWEYDDKILWRGLLKLITDHQPKTLDTLLLLPEKVLMSALASNTQLLRYLVRYLNQNKMIHGKLLLSLESNFAGIQNI